MAVDLRTLVVGDGADAAWVAETLRAGGYSPVCARPESEADLRAAIEGTSWDLVVCAFAGGRAPAGLRLLGSRGVPLEAPLVLLADDFDRAAEAAQRLGATICLRARGLAHLGPVIERALRLRGERAARDETLAFDRGHQEILEQIARGESLPKILERIVLFVERQGAEMLASLLLLDDDGSRVRHGAAPHMPPELVKAIDGRRIGPQEGSCGAAAYLRTPVIIDDIGTHPNWVNYRQLALALGIRACWSSPIFATPGGDVLGTFALYYREARRPTEREQRWVAQATHLAAIAISRDRAERAVRQADARYRQIVDTAYEGIWLVGADGRTLFANHRAARMLGYEPSELIGQRILDFMDESSRVAAEGTFINRLGLSGEQREFRFRRKDGSQFWALLSGSGIGDPQREVPGALCMITDISELKRTEEALRRSEAEFRVVFENAAIGMALVDADGRIARSNPALDRFLGYTEAELRGRRLADFTHADDRQLDVELHRALAAGERDTCYGEKRYVCRDGSVIWGRLSASLVKADSGVPRSIIAMIENINDRRRMEDAVRSSERLRTLMYGAVSDVLFYVGVESPTRFRFLSVNPAFLSATGLTEAEVIGRVVDEVIPQPSQALVLGHYARAVAERRTVRWDEVTAYPAGTRYGEVSITPIFDDAGNCTNLVGTVHDVTARRNAEERVTAQAALLDKAKDAILVRDLDGVIQYWNKGAEHLYGWTSDEVVGGSVIELLYRDDTLYRDVQRVVLETGAWSGEIEQFTRAGKRLIVEGSWTLLQEENGRPRSVLVINSDITERKSLETQVFHIQRLESLGAMAGGIAHDFNNLLTAIIGNVQGAQLELERDHPARETLSNVVEASERCADLVRQLLMFSRKHQSKGKIVKLAPLVQEALRLLRPTLPSRVRVEARFDEDAPEVLADPTQMHQIVMNLGTNAIHAVVGAGTITISLSRAELSTELATRIRRLPPGTYARLVVSDNGVGMDDATLERIFDPFFTTRSAGTGTGLGLSVVHGIVRNHRGGVVVRSAPGRGTEVAIYFPAAPVEPPR